MVAIGAELPKPVAAVAQDIGKRAQRLHVVDHRWLAVKTGDNRVRRPASGHTPLALDGSDERRFFAAHKRAGAFLYGNVEIKTGVLDIFSQETVAAHLGDSLPQPRDRQRVFRSYVNISL